MRQRLIACGGLNRSGSTWQFNAVRELIAAAYPELQIYSSWIDAYRETQSADIHIVKIHALRQLNPHVPDTILSSYRDLRAVAGSLVRMRWVPAETHLISAFLDTYIIEEAIFRDFAHYHMRYEDMVKTPISILAKMAAVLDLQLELEDIMLVHDRLRLLVPPVGEPVGNALEPDEATQLHRGHIGGIVNEAAIEYLTPSIEADIDVRFAEWISDHGYPARRYA